MKAMILVAVFKLLAVKIQPWAPLMAVEQLWEGTEALLTKEVEAAENTNKDKTARHKRKLEQ